MKRSSLLAVAAIAVAGLALGVAGYQALRSDIWSEIAAYRGHPFHGAGRHGNRRSGDRAHGFARLCDRADERHTSAVLALVERTLDIRPDQRAAWTSLTDALRAAQNDIGAACTKAGRGAKNGSAVATLANAETLTEAGLAAIRRIRPAFDSFHRTLTADQKARLDRLLAHRRSR